MTPYLQQLQDSISQQKELLRFLELKEKWLLNKIAEKESELTEYYRNDDLEYIDAKIYSIKIKNEISSLKKVIDEKESYFKKYAAEFEKDWAEVEKHFSELFLKAKSSNNATVKEFLARLNHEMIEREPQTKVFIYKRLKALLK
jgi:hypothetical protein